MSTPLARLAAAVSLEVEAPLGPALAASGDAQAVRAASQASQGQLEQALSTLGFDGEVAWVGARWPKALAPAVEALARVPEPARLRVELIDTAVYLTLVALVQAAITSIVALKVLPSIHRAAAEHHLVVPEWGPSLRTMAVMLGGVAFAVVLAQALGSSALPGWKRHWLRAREAALALALGQSGAPPEVLAEFVQRSTGLRGLPAGTPNADLSALFLDAAVRTEHAMGQLVAGARFCGLLALCLAALGLALDVLLATAMLPGGDVSATDAVGQLVGRLRLLDEAGHPLGLSARAAEGFERDARSGMLSQALPRARGGGTLSDVLDDARPEDAVGVVTGLLPLLAEAGAQARALAAAAAYPLLVAVVVASTAALVWGLTAPALLLVDALPAGRVGAAPQLHALAVLVLALGALVALAMALLAQLPLPLAHRAQRAMAEALAFQTALELVRAGTPLDRALAASARWLRAVPAGQLRAVAAQLTAGAAEPSAHEPLLRTALRLLKAAAQRGVAPAVLEALVAQRRAEAEGARAEALERVQWVALALGGLALAATAGTLFYEYSGAVAGWSGR